MGLLAGLALPAVAAGQGPGVPAVVEVRPAKVTMSAGDRFSFSAVVRDAGGRSLEGTVIRWTANRPDRASVDSAGQLLAHHAGEVEVTARAGAATGSARVRILPGPVATVEVRARHPMMVEGGMTTLDAVARSAGGAPVPGALFTWQTSDPRVATVDPTGVVTARGEGTAILVAGSGAGRGETRVRVVRNRVERLTLIGPTSARTGEVVRFRILATDRRELPVEDVPVRWVVSSDLESGPGAEIGADGGFVASRPGRYLVSAIAGSVAGTHRILAEARSGPGQFETLSSLPELPARALAVHGTTAWIAGAGGLRTVDLSDPGRPRVTDSLPAGRGVIEAIALDAEAQTGGVIRRDPDGDRIVLIDLADPGHPTRAAEVFDGPGRTFGRIGFDGGFLYAADLTAGAARVWDVSDARHPLEVGRWSPAPAGTGEGPEPDARMSGRFVLDVEVRNGLALVALGLDGVAILDVGRGTSGGSPAAPREIGRFRPEPGSGVHAVALAGGGRYGFLTAGTAGNPTPETVLVLDLEDPAQPVLAAEYAVAGGTIESVAVEEELLLIGYGPAGAHLVDVSGELRGDLAVQGRTLGVLAPPGVRTTGGTRMARKAGELILLIEEPGGFLVTRMISPERP